MNLKTFAAALLLGVSSTAAMAADLPSRRVAPAPVAVAPIFTWSGFYAGVQAGYGWDKVSFSNALVAFPAPIYSSGTLNRSGFIGGGHIGYLMQTGPGVFGLEGDLEGATIRGSNLRGSLRARAGVAFDRTLAYVTGGLALANQNYGWTNYYGYNTSATRLGWTAGAGIECMIAPNWSARVEYRYSDFGKVNLNNVIASSVGRTEHSVRLGVSYHFNTGATGPVVAKY